MSHLYLTDLYCKQCKHIFESLLQKDSEDIEQVISDNEDVVCPKCSSQDLGVVLGGWRTKLNSREETISELKRRSKEHSLREVKKLAGHKGTLPPEFGEKGCGIG